MTTLTGLPGVAGDTIEAEWVSSRTEAMRAFRDGAKAVTSSGSNGALNVWLDDEGWYRCEFHRHLRVIGRERFRWKAAVDEWLREWLPLLND